MFEEWCFLSEPIVRLNSINVLEAPALPFLSAASFSEFNCLKELSPTEILFLLSNPTQEGIVSF